MKKLILILSIIQIVFLIPVSGQLYNDGAEVTIQDDALLYIEGNFINQGGTIFNSGLIEVGGDWENTVSTNPLNPGSGNVDLVGGDQVIGGDFNTLFNNLSLRDDQTITLNSTIGIQNTVSLANGTIDLNRNTLHILNSSRDALVTSGGNVKAETADQYGYLRWDISDKADGNYSIPFISSSNVEIPVTFEITEQGNGDLGYLLFSTFNTDEANNPLPLEVTNLEIKGADDGLNLIDRFWNIQAVDYTIAPNTSASFTLDIDNDLGGLNAIDLDKLEVFNWNKTTGDWSSIGLTNLDDDLVEIAVSNVYGDYVIGSNVPTAVIDLEKLVDISVYPNPTENFIFITLDGDANEKVDVSLINQHGKIVLQQSEFIQNGTNQFRIDLETLPAGIYHSVIIGETRNGVKKFVKL